MALSQSERAGQGLSLRAREVSVTVDGTRLLAPASLEVRTGELVALIGPSGSGKTSLLRVLAGMSDPDEGEVTLGADPVLARSQEVGYLPEGDILHDRLTVREALHYTGRLRLAVGTSDAAIEGRVESVLADLR